MAEEGTVAGVSPGGAAPPKDEPIDVKIDRPFTYVIRDDKRGEILFVGEYGGE